MLYGLCSQPASIRTFHRWLRVQRFGWPAAMPRSAVMGTGAERVDGQPLRQCSTKATPGMRTRTTCGFTYLSARRDRGARAQTATTATRQGEENRGHTRGRCPTLAPHPGLICPSGAPTRGLLDSLHRLVESGACRSDDEASLRPQRLLMAVGCSRHRVLPMAVSPGTTKRWVNPSPAQTPRHLVIHGGFPVDDGHTRRLERRARRLGFADLRSYLQARCDAGLSIPQLAAELGVTPWMVKQQLTQVGVTLPPRLSGWPASAATPPSNALPRGPPSSASTTSRRT
jgi:hypothetical protein